MKRLTAAWIRKAESDFRVAKNQAAMRPPAHDEVCFHCQQSAEKFFKALLQEWGLPVPKIHANAPKARAALRRAERIRFEVRTRLGLRTKS
jgi:HEPN domain-containing protein